MLAANQYWTKYLHAISITIEWYNQDYVCCKEELICQIIFLSTIAGHKVFQFQTKRENLNMNQTSEKSQYLMKNSPFKKYCQWFSNFIINIAPDKRVTKCSDVPLTSSINCSGHTNFIRWLIWQNCDIETNFIGRLYHCIKKERCK